MYANCPIIWESRIEMEISLSTTESKYIQIYQAMRDVLLFMSLTKKISFMIKLEDNVPKIESSIFEKMVIVHEDNQGTISVIMQMRPRMKHTANKYHHFRSFVANRIIKIQHVDTREHIT